MIFLFDDVLMVLSIRLVVVLLSLFGFGFFVLKFVIMVLDVM